MSDYVLMEIIDNIKELLEEIAQKDKAELTEWDLAPKFAYAECLQIIHDDIPEELRAKVGIDIDIDSRYLF